MKVRTTILALLVASLVTPVGRAAATSCAPAGDGGEWPSYGHDLSNSRNQPLESRLNPSTVKNIATKFVFNTANAVPANDNGGSFSNTPVIADGCVFLASNSGWVFALNADTGDGSGPGNTIWRTKLPGQGQALLGGVIVGSPVVANGLVFVGVSDPGKPYVAALDQTTGALQWRTVIEVGQANALINASPVHYDADGSGPHPGYIFQGFAGNEGGSVARGGYAIVDAGRSCELVAGDQKAPTFCASSTAGATGGRVVQHRHTIPDADYNSDKKYRGASVWCTAAVDPVDLHIYACGGNPASKKFEHRNSNALLKIDGNPARATFGDIVDSYKGDVDQYYPGLDRQPVCDMFGETIAVIWSLACLQLDLDFGSSPNLFRDEGGNLMLGDLQKSGIYHALYADHMQRAWTTALGTPCQACNAASPAYDDVRKQVYVPATPGSTVWAVTSYNGRYRWASAVPDTIHFQPVSTANGVVYTVDGLGFLTAIDADTGVLAARRSLSADVGRPAGDASSQGVAIARSTIYVNNGPYLIAYS